MLFVSGSTVGGSGRSQRELAARLEELGHEVRFVVRDERGRRGTIWIHKRLVWLSVRLGNRTGARPLRWITGRLGRTTRTESIEGLLHFATPVPENAVDGVIASFRPDVVVGNSLHPQTWRMVRAESSASAIATILYIREAASLNHFDNGVQPADVVVANAESLQAAVEDLGVTCAFVASVIELGVTLTESTRRTALVINAVESRGIETIWKAVTGQTVEANVDTGTAIVTKDNVQDFK